MAIARTGGPRAALFVSEAGDDSEGMLGALGFELCLQLIDRVTGRAQGGLASELES